MSQLRSLVEKSGVVVHPLSLTTASLPLPAFTNLLHEISIGAIDIVMFRTAAGVAQFIDNLPQHDQRRTLDSLADIRLIAASSESAKALRQYGLEPNINVAGDSRWRNVLAVIDESFPVTERSGSPLAMVQIALEDCGDWFSLSSGLEARGARVRQIPLFPKLVDERELKVRQFFRDVGIERLWGSWDSNCFGCHDIFTIIQTVWPSPFDGSSPRASYCRLLF